METITKVGLIGLGLRGLSLLQQVLLKLPNVQVAAVCDVYADRMDAAAKELEAAGRPPAAQYADYNELLLDQSVEAVLVMSSWDTHISIAIAAMRCNKAVGMEVGGCYSVEECWALVHTWEQAQVPFMFLENCCYGRTELMVLQMVRKQLLGTPVHCMGAYRHDLRDEVSTGEQKHHYRLRNYLNRNLENYPTHELGPIAKLLNINRGNRMLTLTSTASKAIGLHEYLVKLQGFDSPLANVQFAQGDIVTTVIKCAGGQTITLCLDTTLPRPYSRGFTVQGTRGMYSEDTDSVFIDGVHNEYDFKWKEQWGNAEQYRKEYEHPIWRDYLARGVQGGHDGIDWLVLNSFFYCLQNQLPMPIDVYDAAAWMAVSALSEQSIATGSAPVYMPDFTCGKWLQPVPTVRHPYTI